MIELKDLGILDSEIENYIQFGVRNLLATLPGLGEVLKMYRNRWSSFYIDKRDESRPVYILQFAQNPPLLVDTRISYTLIDVEMNRLEQTGQATLSATFMANGNLAYGRFAHNHGSVTNKIDFQDFYATIVGADGRTAEEARAFFNDGYFPLAWMYQRLADPDRLSKAFSIAKAAQEYYQSVLLVT